MFDTRNPNDTEKRTFDNLNREREALRLNLMDFETEVKTSYALPAECGVAPNGAFVMGNAPLPNRILLKKAKPGTPKKRLAAMTQGEVDKMSELRSAMQMKVTAIERFIHELRVECDAPHVAKMNADFDWCRPDTGAVYCAPDADSEMEGDAEPYVDPGDEPEGGLPTDEDRAEHQAGQVGQ